MGRCGLVEKGLLARRRASQESISNMNLVVPIKHGDVDYVREIPCPFFLLKHVFLGRNLHGRDVLECVVQHDTLTGFLDNIL